MYLGSNEFVGHVCECVLLLMHCVIKCIIIMNVTCIDKTDIQDGKTLKGNTF